jgi:oxygen-independent coproporphyrinogen-3 oxidase
LFSLPPLSLYVHLPWCLSKCPYCDFNSHAVKGTLPAGAYVDALLRDLEQELPLVWGRTVHSIFLGGGTPSLFPAAQIDRLLGGIRGMATVSPDAEVTMEANPGTTEHDVFSAYRDAGVNRISLGVQSFDDRLLAALGRIHGRREVEEAVRGVRDAGFENFNIDLMFALPGQGLAGALADVDAAIECGPSHVSHYQLTIEPNTVFHARAPELPDEELAWTMQEGCSRRLAEAGYGAYEISAWSRKGRECRHNLNYWRYGDFLGIGAGAHGKITLAAEQAVRRRVRNRHPRRWMEDAASGAPIAENRPLGPEERVFEFFLNQLRLRDGVLTSQFEPRTGVPWAEVSERVDQAVSRGLLERSGERLQHTERGWRFVNETQALFLP